MAEQIFENLDRESQCQIVQNNVLMKKADTFRVDKVVMNERKQECLDLCLLL